MKHVSDSFTTALVSGAERIPLPRSSRLRLNSPTQIQLQVHDLGIICPAFKLHLYFVVEVGGGSEISLPRLA